MSPDFDGHSQVHIIRINIPRLETEALTIRKLTLEKDELDSSETILLQEGNYGYAHNFYFLLILHACLKISVINLHL